MVRNKGFYKLSPDAEKDIEDIFDYTFYKFGYDQAVEYVAALETAFESLVFNPELGIARNEIRLGIRSLPYISHIVFYMINRDDILIVRVLHGSRDLPKYFQSF